MRRESQSRSDGIEYKAQVAIEGNTLIRAAHGRFTLRKSGDANHKWQAGMHM